MKIDSKRAERLIIVAVLGLMLGTLVVKGLSGKLYANIGISSPIKLFWREPGEIRQGDYVVFTLEHPILEKPAVVVKRVRCTSGQHLEVTDDAAWCEGKLLGHKKQFTLKGEPMPKFTFNGDIEKGWVFVMNEHKDSFDSRYYGLKPVEMMTRVKPLF